jgi:hypothetical protein
MTPFWSWLEASAAGRAVAGSVEITAVLSAVHVVGITLLAGSVIVSALQLLGVLFPESPPRDLTQGLRAGILLGLVLSLVTGALLFSARATAAVQNEFFQLKMALLASAILFHVAVYHRLLLTDHRPTLFTRGGGAVAVTLWVGVVGAGCAYILLE